MRNFEWPESPCSERRVPTMKRRECGEKIGKRMGQGEEGEMGENREGRKKEGSGVEGRG
jgi:hypothetical protein